ncbi:MAG: hypothetical protein K6E21_05520 [Bacilli bacterium]|nr:hypothetical protein [Bacilli bacterium]
MLFLARYGKIRFCIREKIKRIRLDEDLHVRFTDTVFALQHILSNYKLIFPDFTDHPVSGNMLEVYS